MRVGFLVDLADGLVAGVGARRQNGTRKALRIATTIALLAGAASAGATTLTVSTKTLPAGYVGTAYSTKLAATGGAGSGYVWSVSTGTLPSGLSLASGVISGTPKTAVMAKVTLKVTDSAKNTATASFTLTIDPALTVNTAALAAGYVGSTYSAPLAATGGSGTGYVWSVSKGTLPSGLSLAGSEISGTPTTANVTSVTLKVTDSVKNSATATFSITMDAALKVTTSSLAAGYVGVAYSVTLASTGGTGKGLKWSVSTGKLPAGLSLAAATGIITGNATTAGATNVTVEVEDSLSHTATAKLALTVNPALAVGTTTLPAAYVGLAYRETLVATGGSGNGQQWTVTTGVLPSGLTLVASTGGISGKPVAKGSSAITIKVTDSAANAATAKLTLVVNADLSVSTAALGTAYVGTKYLMALAATGGSGTGDTWSLASGMLPEGLALSTGGAISGTPTAAGSSMITFAVKDSVANTATAKLTLTVGPELEIASPSTLPVGYTSGSYSDTLKATGGSGTGYKWSLTGTPPQGLSLSSAGVLSGLPAAAKTSTLDVKVTDSAGNVATATMTLVVNSAIATCTNDAAGTAYVELHGVYSFTMNRFNLTTNTRYASVGSFNADGLGNIRDGVMDSNGASYPSPVSNTFTGNYTVGSDGRGRMNLMMSAAGGQPAVTDTFCFSLDTFTKGVKYNPAFHATVVEDDGTNNVSSGELYGQTVQPTLVAVKGTWVVSLAGRRHNPAIGVPDFRTTTAGYITLDGNGNVTSGEVDQNKDGLNGNGELANEYTAATAVTGSYTMPTVSSGTPTGRGTLRFTGTGGSSENFVFYPGGPNYIILLETDNANPAGGTPVAETVGFGIRRSGSTFTTATGLLGSSVRSQYFLANAGEANESEGVGIDVAVWDGKGNFTYTGDMNSKGVATTTSGSGTYTVSSNGRFAMMQGGVCSPCGYLYGTDKGFAIFDSVDGGSMTLDLQAVPNGPFELSLFLGAYSVGSEWYIFPEQQALSGAVVSNGSGTITGTLDQNQDGETTVNDAVVETEATTSTSGAHGRFLLYPNTGSFNYALYIVSTKYALGIPLGGDNGETQPLNVYVHQ